MSSKKLILILLNKEVEDFDQFSPWFWRVIVPNKGLSSDFEVVQCDEKSVHWVNHYLRLRFGIQSLGQASKACVQRNQSNRYAIMKLYLKDDDMITYKKSSHSRAHLCISFLKSSGISLFESIHPGNLHQLNKKDCKSFVSHKSRFLLFNKIFSHLVNFWCVRLDNFCLHQDRVDMMSRLLPIFALTETK